MAELIVATTLLAIVMAAVYTALNSTLRIGRLGETDLNTYQDARTALAILSRELNCIVRDSEEFFVGTDNEFEFFAVVPPMAVEEGKGPRVLWVHYRYNPSTKTLFREEAVVKDALPSRRPDEETVDRSRIKLGRKRKFEFVTDVLGFDVSYYWIPPESDEEKARRKNDEPPVPITPFVLKESRDGWGRPQGVRVRLTLQDPNAESGRAAFENLVTFRTPPGRCSEKQFARIGGYEES